MIQKKGCAPMDKLQNCKIMLPSNQVDKQYIIDHVKILCGDILNLPEDINSVGYLTVRNGEVGYGLSLRNYVDCNFMEVSCSEILLYEQVPLKLTLKEIEGLLGHQIEIIKEN